MSEEVIISALLQRFQQIKPEPTFEGISENLNVYQYDGDKREKLDSFDDFLKSLQNLPARIAFVYKSPIGYYVSVIQYVGGTAMSKKKQKPIEESLETTSMYLEELLSNIGRIVVISNAIFSINKSKKRMRNVYNRNVKFSSSIGIVDIQNNAKPFSDLLARYTSPEIISQIPQKTKKKTKKTRFKNWSYYEQISDLYKLPILFVFVMENELRKYGTTQQLLVKLREVFAGKHESLPKGLSLIQIVKIFQPSSRKVSKKKYTYPEMFRFTLINKDGAATVSERTWYAPRIEMHTMNIIARKQIDEIDQEIP